MRNNYLILISIIVLNLVNNEDLYSQPQLIWERFNIVPNGSSLPIDLKVDSSGNIYNLCSEGGFTVLKYDKYGTLKWRVYYDHPNLRLSTSPKSMAIDKEGNVYCVGDNNYEIVTIKIDSNGRLDWVRAFNPGAGFYTAGGIAIDPSGNIVVAGGSPSNFQRIIYGVIKYAPDGDTVWVKVKSDVSPYTGGITKSIKITHNGYIYIAGYVYFNNTGECLVAKINESGKEIWTKKFIVGGSIRHLLIDKNEEYLYSVGAIENENENTDILINKLNMKGNLIWSRRYDTDEGYFDELRGAVIDKENNVIFTARSGVLTPTFILTVKYDTIGSLVWERRFIANSSRENYPFDIISDKDNNIYVTGDATFGTGEYWLMNLIKYNSNGNLLWNVFNGTPLRRNTGLSLIKTGDFIYVTGQMKWTSGQYNSILLKYSENPLNIKGEAENLNFELNQNYPNPFNPKTKINYSINKQSLVSIKVYDINGKHKQTLVNEVKNSGNFEVEFNGSNLPSGIYFYTLYINNEKTKTRKMVLIK